MLLIQHWRCANFQEKCLFWFDYYRTMISQSPATVGSASSRWKFAYAQYLLVMSWRSHISSDGITCVYWSCFEITLFCHSEWNAILGSIVYIARLNEYSYRSYFILTLLNHLVYFHIIAIFTSSSYLVEVCSDLLRRNLVLNTSVTSIMLPSLLSIFYYNSYAS